MQPRQVTRHRSCREPASRGHDPHERRRPRGPGYHDGLSPAPPPPPSSPLRLLLHACLDCHHAVSVEYLSYCKQLHSVHRQYIVIIGTANLKKNPTYQSLAYSYIFLYTYVAQLLRSVKNINTVPVGEVNSRRTEETHRQPPRPAQPLQRPDKWSSSVSGEGGRRLS